MKQIKCAIVGYGNRGSVYGDYSLAKPEEVSIEAVIDPNPFKLQLAKQAYKLKDEQLYLSLDEFIAKKIPLDVMINTTMDQDHYDIIMKILSAGYNMLTEKPIVANKEELLNIQALAKKNNCLVFVCHVLRYTPYFVKIKSLLNEGAIGEIMTMEMNEHVCIQHYLTSYDRGKWNDEKTCGSPFLLAKCCHDMDLISWLNNASRPVSVASFGGRKLFIEEKAPKDHTKYCYQCPHVDDCIYSAKKIYLEMDPMPFLTWDRLNKPLNEITKEEKEEFLKHDIYGECAYTCGGDLVDRQNLIVNFENGSVVSFNLVGGSCKADRYIHIVGSNGEIEGKLEEGILTIRRPFQKDEIIDLNKEIVITVKFGGHNGGDFAIMHDMVRYLNGYRDSISITSIDDSINGHLIVFAAEESRKSGQVTKIGK